jgi:hypothetical protein
VDSVAAMTGPRPVLKAALITTGMFLLWPLLAHQNGPRLMGGSVSSHIVDTLASMVPWAVPIVGVGIVAFLSGSRAKLRSLFLVALVGGIVLTPILAARFVASDIEGALPVRGLMLRESIVGEPAMHADAAKYDSEAILQLDLELQSIREGWSPSFLLDDQKPYLGPAEDEPLTCPQLSLETFDTRAEAVRHWELYGDSLRARYQDALTWQANEATLLQQALDEPFPGRLASSLPYGLVVALLWGGLLAMMQGIGLKARKLVLRALRNLGWTHTPQAARR